MDSFRAEHLLTHQALTLSVHNTAKERHPLFLSSQLILLPLNLPVRNHPFPTPAWPVMAPMILSPVIGSGLGA